MNSDQEPGHYADGPIQYVFILEIQIYMCIYYFTLMEP